MVNGGLRLLAAVMFTDMVGYTALMQEDEKKAKQLRDRQREVLEDKTTEHQGRILEYFGDGSLSIFGSALEAVLCAIEIQHALQKEPVVPLRIGLHTGDIAFTDDGVFGDAVNLASRIETLSVPGGVLISDKMYDEIKNHKMIRAKRLGAFHLKNVKEAVPVYAISNEGLTVPSVQEMKGKTGGGHKSIAVLPFINMSGDQDNEYFSDGITEEIINALTRVEGLHVTSRTSVFAFKGLNEDVREIGRKLSVDHVLEGSVRKAGTKVRVTAQLIKTEDGFHIWSEVFDRHLEDIFNVQDEISRKIATKLKEDFVDQELVEPLVEPCTESMEAYNLYLKAQFHWHKWTPHGARKAVEYYRAAIKAAPGFAEAYSGLANSYMFLGAIGHLPPKEAYKKAEKMAQRAIKLDDKIVESHISLALVKLFYHWDFKGVRKSFKKAARLNKESTELKHAYALYFKIMGEHDAAIRRLEEALQHDPLSLAYNTDLARAYLNAGRNAEALEHFEKALELDPNFRSALDGKGWAYVALKDYDNAERVFREYRKKVDHKLKGITQLGYILGKRGKSEEAKQYLNIVAEREKEENSVSLSMDYAVIYLGLGEYDKVFKYLKKSIDERLGSVLFINSNPIWDEIKSDPRYDKLLKEIGLDQQKKVIEQG